MVSLAQRLYGTDEAVEPARVLRAGPLTLELRRGRLRRIRCGEHELWHGLAFVLRDADWGSPEPVIDLLDVVQGDEAFDVRVEGHWEAPARVAFQLRFTGDAEGCIRVDAEAEPSVDVSVNRLGLCLLHPLEVCGARVQVAHVDGRSSDTRFPTLIPPWPPFMLVRGLRHEWAPGRWSEATLDGDVFETEDQRNNGDASFKTYSRSNMAPRPYRLDAGVALRQSALLRVQGPSHAAASSRPPAPQARAVAVVVGAGSGDWLPVGVEIHADDALEPALLPALRDLRPAHLHLAWRPGAAVHWPGIAAMLQAGGARLRLDALLPGAHDAAAALQAMQVLRAELDAAGIVPGALAVFPSSPAHIDAARRALAPLPVGGGTPHFFVQLSRLDAWGAVDFASFTTASVVHGADDDEVMLGLASLPGMVATCRARHPALPLCIGPNAIAARSSPLGAQPPSDGTRRLALAAVDPRSRAQFGAAWALGHVAGFAQDGVQALTLLALRGPHGVLAVDGGVVTRYPVFEVVSQLGAPAQRLEVSVSQPRRVAAVALRRGAQAFVLIANLGAEPIDVAVTGLARGAMHRRLEPYAVDRIETAGEPRR